MRSVPRAEPVAVGTRPRAKGTPRDLAGVLRFAEDFLSKCDELLPRMNLRHRQTFQSTSFPSGLTHDGNSSRAPEIHFVFKIIQECRTRVSDVASPGGFEPPFPP